VDGMQLISVSDEKDSGVIIS